MLFKFIYIILFILGFLAYQLINGDNFIIGNDVDNSISLSKEIILIQDPTKCSDCPRCILPDITDNIITITNPDRGFPINVLYESKFNSSNCIFFNSSMSASYINSVAREVFFNIGQTKEDAEFSSKRVGLFFKPGIYGTDEMPIRIKVNYYTGVYGLGKLPDDVQINGTIQVCNVDSYDNLTSSCNWAGPMEIEDDPASRLQSGIKCPKSQNDPSNSTICTQKYHGALDNFWRGIENLTLNVNNINKFKKYSNQKPNGSYVKDNPNSWPTFDEIIDSQNTNYSFSDNSFILDDERDKQWFAHENKGNPRNIKTYNSWAASQACAIRRLIVKGNITFSETQGDSSGGFVADSKFTPQNPDTIIPQATIGIGTQQQYLVRNCEINMRDHIRVNGGAWNIVYVNNNVTDQLFEGWQGYSSKKVSTVITNNNFIAQKPYIYYDIDDSVYKLAKPKPTQSSEGPSDYSNYDIISLDDDKYIIISKVEDFNNINNKIKYIIITPNVYQLNKSIEVSGTFIILGIGMPTIRAPPDSPAIVAKNIKNSVLAGILIEASVGEKSCLVDWGNSKNNDNNDHCFIHDLYCRVGGNLNPKDCCVRVNEAMVKISQSNTIIDNAWLWVADHGNNMPPGDNCKESNGQASWEKIWENAYCPTCLIVTETANNVHAYCLQAEHSTGDHIVKWYGDNGEIYMFQSEYPYHPVESTKNPKFNFNDKKYNVRAISVDNTSGTNGSNLSVYGGGAYTYFPCPSSGSGIKVDSAFDLGGHPGDYNLFTIRLDGNKDSGINNIYINSKNTECRNTQTFERCINGLKRHLKDNKSYITNEN